MGQGTEAAAPSAESLADFLRAVRGPLQYLSTSSTPAAARTQFQATAFAQRGRHLEGRCRSGPRRDLLARLCAHLELCDAAPPPEKIALARACCLILVELEQATEPAPEYQHTTGDPADAIEQLKRPVRFAKHVGPRTAPLLEKAGLGTVEDLLYHLPFRYEDRRAMATIASASPGQEASLVGELVQLQDRAVGRGARRILEGVLRDPTGLLGLTWYNLVPYFRSRYRIGERYLVYGRVEQTPGGGKRIVHPEVDASPSEAAGGIVPVYQKPTSMNVGVIRKITAQATRDLAPQVPSVLPRAIALQARIVDLATALRYLHLPESDAEIGELNGFASLAHRSVVFDELFYLQLGMLLRRRATAREPGLSLPQRGELSRRLADALPFALTGAQRRVLSEIYRDMERPAPMHRLVQGDVGSGKTIVALFAALVAIDNGRQAAFMAPTELLAEQHFRTVSAFTQGLGVRAVLLTGSATRAEKKQLREELTRGEIQLVVGTHALIQEGVQMPHLGLGVIDEQHRFGVLQRAAMGQLRGDGSAASPDILLMSATPIPRTLALTVYGDLDVSVLDEMPPGRKPVRTMLFSETQRARVYQLVQRELDQGRQAYVVYPLVDASDKQDLRDATTMAAELKRAVFSKYRVALLHGRMKPDQKAVVMRRFQDGDYQLLVSTTVIEVGVDVPNATVMVVEHAERFGLSQLHQLRGRVGRGSAESMCMLIAPFRRDSESQARLATLRETNDGFAIAEADLRLRGPGEFLGTRQSGLPDFRVANLLRDSRLLAEARAAAETCLAADPDLGSTASAALRQVLYHRWAGRLGLAEVG